jgi:hypothetical protein
MYFFVLVLKRVDSVASSNELGDQLWSYVIVSDVDDSFAPIGLSEFVGDSVESSCYAFVILEKRACGVRVNKPYWSIWEEPWYKRLWI